MVLGIGQLSLSQIRGEFGGAASDSLSEYYANSAYNARGVMSGQRGYPSGGAATNIPSSGQISFSNFHAARLLTPKSLGFSGTYSVSSYTVYPNVEYSYAGIVIEQDGGSSVNLESASDGNSYVTTQTWLTAKESTTIGNSFWVRFTLSSSGGSGSGTRAIDGSTGWLQLSTFRTRFIWAAAWTGGGSYQATTASATYAIDIASDSAGTNIVSSSSINLLASSTAEP